jgi:hypothetical protein
MGSLSLPEWLLGQASMTLFRRVVQGFAYLFIRLLGHGQLAPTVREVMKKARSKEEPHHGAQIQRKHPADQDTTVREV